MADASREATNRFVEDQAPTGPEGLGTHSIDVREKDVAPPTDGRSSTSIQVYLQIIAVVIVTMLSIIAIMEALS